MHRFGVLLCACILSVAAATPAAAAPRIVSVGLEPGNPFSLAIVAEDPGSVVGAVEVRFGAGDGRFAESSCRLTRTGRPAHAGRGRRTFHVPWAPLLLGLRTLDVRATSDACGAAPREARRSVKLRVGALPVPGRAKARSSLDLRGCAHAFLRPNGRNARKLRSAVACLVNVQRAARGLPALRPSRRLQRAAKRHANDLASRGYFGHTVPGGPALADRLRLAGFWPADAAENLAQATGVLATPFSVVLAWMHSDGHSDNLFDRGFTHLATAVSVGGAAAYYTSDFGHAY
jgi:uncharacterized protein YkwD